MTRFRRDDDIVELQKAASDGDQQAWRALVEHFSPLIWSVARAHRLSYSDSQDIHQFVWLSLTQHLGRINEPAALGGWIYAVARNECLRMIRQGARQVPTDTVITPDGLDDRGYADAYLLLQERNEELWRAVAELPGTCPQLLRALMSDPPPAYDEIASRFNMAVGSVGPTRGRCLRCLRRRLL